MKVAFVHPDLGIGGAERLVVDAAKSLQDRGHEVVIYTSHHNPAHCFEETKKELKVVVRGDFLPRHVLGKFHLFFAAIRSLYLALWLYCFGPLIYDVIFVDQVPYSIPLLRKCSRKIIFYCHFPDKYLAPSSSNSLLPKLLYRRWFDRLEELTILMADCVLVNSKFTASIYTEAFPSSFSKSPVVLYPPVNSVNLLTNYKADPLFPGRSVITSLNRFERKKNIKIALEAFEKILSSSIDNEFHCLLVIAGGYDYRVGENVDYLVELQEECKKREIKYSTIWPGDTISVNLNVKVIFMPSIKETNRNTLIKHSKCLIYTPLNEHFGIVPVESMVLGTPVIAMNSGGPLETVKSGSCGFLTPPDATIIADHMQRLIINHEEREVMSKYAQEYASSTYSIDSFGNKLEEIIMKNF